MRRRFSSGTILSGTILIGKNSLLKEGLAKILHSANFRITASVSCADDLLTSKGLPPQLLFLIFHIGDAFDAAIKQIELIRNRHPGGNIGIVTDRYRLEELVLAFRSGANGYFVDVMSCDVFIKSLELMMMGETVFPPEFLSFFLDSESHQADEAGPYDLNNETIVSDAKDPVPAQLSPREQTILRCLIEGDSNKSIGRKCDIAEATVKVHVKAILRKIRVHNRTQAAIWWINNGSPAQRVAYEPGQANKPLADDLGEIPEINRVTAHFGPIADRRYAVRPISKGVNDLRADSLARLRK
jgi:DNA-binding NarL/FixJ family response regulator